MSSVPASADRFEAWLPEFRTWHDRPTPQQLRELPATPAVFAWLAADGAPIQLASAQNLRHAAMTRIHAPTAVDDSPPANRRADLGAIARAMRWRPVACAFEGKYWYYRIAREMYPRAYRELISFGPAYFLHVDWAATIPEIQVTERIWRMAGEFLGPWPTQRSARAALDTLWDLFDLCRYPEQIRRLPRGTRCAYADMGRCNAPCDGSVSLAAYVERCRGAWRFASGARAAWRDEATDRMRDAAAAQRFEQAGLIKQQLARAEAWAGAEAGPIVESRNMRWAILLRATRRRAWRIMLFDRGALIEGPLLREKDVSSAGGKWLEERLERSPVDAVGLPEPASSVRMEQTWLASLLLNNPSRHDATPIALPCADTAMALRTAVEGHARNARSSTGDSTDAPAWPDE